MKKFLFTAALFAAIGAVTSARAALQVTEIWAGGISGAETTSDWFELTNTGVSAESISGFYYDDDSADPTKNDPLVGVSSIAPGESAIFLVSWEDDFATAGDAITAFTNMWGAPNGDLTGVQIGYVVGGSGLGGTDDAVFVFDGNTVSANTVASQAYAGPTTEATFFFPVGTSNENLSVAGSYGAYEGNLPASDGTANPNVGSPGVSQSPVPEPTMLLVFAGLASALGVTRTSRS